MKEIEEFLLNFTSKGTIKCYKTALKHFFNTIKVKPENYFKKKRNYENDVITYWKKLQEKAPKTRKTRMSVIRVFLEENNVLIPNKTWKKLSKRSKGKRAITIDKIPTHKELRQILQHGDIMSRAITLIACSSGMRIGEILSLIPNDIDFKSNPTKINIRGEITKSGDPRITFISNEATEVLKEWFKVRDEWFKVAIEKTRGVNKKNPDDKRIFPIDYSSYDRKWMRLLKKSGLNERDMSSKYHVFHFHTIRKFFETRMSYSGVPEAIYQQLEGHEGYLNGAYKRYTEDELRNYYLKGMNELLIFETTPDLTNINKQLDEKDKQIQELLEFKKLMELKIQGLENKLEIEKIKNGKK